nr:uncharacterized protein LOC123771980 [Procambarus clarkii]
MAVVLVSATKATMMVNADTVDWSARASVRQTQPIPPPARPTLHDTFQKMDKMSLNQLVIFSDIIKPYSCCCIKPGDVCQIEIPKVPFYKILNVTCGHLDIYCCMKCKEDPDQENSPINRYQNMTTAEELKSFLDTMTDILRHQENKILVGNTTANGKDLQEEGSHCLCDHSSQHAKKDVTVNEEKEEEISIITGHVITKRTHNFEDGIILAIKGVVHRLLAVSARQQMITTLDDKRTNTFPSKNESKISDSSKNEIQEFDTKTEIGNGLYSHIQTSQLNGVNDTTHAIFNIDDLAVPYDDLGWFSKVVENGMNLSFSAAIIIVVMFMASQVLVGAFYIINEICFVCKLLGYANVASIS